jgi:hypothetical protein
MIVFELICGDQHRFEGWFASGDDFERQRAKGLLACPICATGAVSKLPTAKLGRSAEAPAGPANPRESPLPAAAGGGQQLRVTVAAFVDFVLRNTEDVGRAFPEEARRIHRHEAPQRGIRGSASPEEVEALQEEGIGVISVPLPIPPREGFH